MRERGKHLREEMCEGKVKVRRKRYLGQDGETNTKNIGEVSLKRIKQYKTKKHLETKGVR